MLSVDLNLRMESCETRNTENIDDESIDDSDGQRDINDVKEASSDVDESKQDGDDQKDCSKKNATKENILEEFYNKINSKSLPSKDELENIYECKTLVLMKLPYYTRDDNIYNSLCFIDKSFADTIDNIHVCRSRSGSSYNGCYCDCLLCKKSRTKPERSHITEDKFYKENENDIPWKCRYTTGTSCYDYYKKGNTLYYAYIDFKSIEDAKNALNNHRFVKICEKEWQDCQFRYRVNRNILNNQTSKNKIFVKNLNQNIDESALIEMFSAFGQVLCVRVYRKREWNSTTHKYDDPKSLEYGWVQFILPNHAKLAIETVDGMVIDGRKIHCEYWKPTKIIKAKETLEIKNLYVWGFYGTIDKLAVLWKHGDVAALLKVFVGPIVSREWWIYENVMSGCFSFDNDQDATRGVDILDGAFVAFDENGTEFHKLKVDKCVKRKARQMNYFKYKYLERKTYKVKDMIKLMENDKKLQRLAFYVKNIDDTKGYQEVKKMFEEYGKVLDLKYVNSKPGKDRKRYRQRKMVKTEGGNYKLKDKIEKVADIDVSINDYGRKERDWNVEGVFVLYENVNDGINALKKIYGVCDERKEMVKLMLRNDNSIPLKNPLLSIKKSGVRKKRRDKDLELYAVIMAVLPINRADFKKFVV